MMFYDKVQAIKACEEDPSLIFNLIKDGYGDEVIDEVITKNKVSINTCDNIGNDVMMRLLKYKHYDLVEKFMQKRDWDVNHQNEDGNTFGHMLASDNSVSGLKLLMKLTKKKNYVPNIKNKKSETALDKSVQNKTVAALKILEDKRFDNIDLISFKKLFNTYINNTYYGKYSKLNNLEVIVDSLEKKDLVPNMRILIKKIEDNMDNIKTAIMKNNSKALNIIIDSSLMEATL